MANTFTAPTWIKSKPHASAEKQVGDSDPSARTDVINRPSKGFYAAIRRIYNTLFDGITLDFTDLTTVTAFTNAAKGQRGYRFGLTVSNNVGDATNDIDIAAGEAMSNDAALADRVLMVLASGLTKQLDVAWAVGTNQGMRATGAAIANGTYHIFLIERPDTGVVDVAADTSVTGANIAANTDAAYTKKRRIRSILREAGAIVGEVQDGGYVRRKASVLDVDISAPGTAEVTRTMSVPLDLNLFVMFNAYSETGVGGATDLYFRDPASTDEAVSATVAPLTQLFTPVSSIAAGTFLIRCSTSRNIASRHRYSDANVLLRMATLGYYDSLGRDA